MSEFNPSLAYRGILTSAASRAVLDGGRIVPEHLPTSFLLDRITETIVGVEMKFGADSTSGSAFASSLVDLIESGVCILGTPLLTNLSAGHATLSSCVAVPFAGVDLTPGGLSIADAYYRLNMGSGYNLEHVEDPVAVLLALNAQARAVERSKVCERYVGNIAHVPVDHPRVREFIDAKVENQSIVHFNTSIDVSAEFMDALSRDGRFTLRDGTVVDADDVWTRIVEAAWMCGDPGIISLARFNAGNPVADISPYVTTAPCAEVGLAPGEACVFGYINLAACIKKDQAGLSLDDALLGRAARTLARTLDDCVEFSLDGYPTADSQAVMRGNRKIGIGICGFADLLIWLGLDYGSPESLDLLDRALGTINLHSKLESVCLASERGPFPNFERSRFKSSESIRRYFGRGVREDARNALVDAVALHGLRNAMTTALPPSGRSALLLGVNSSIEPYLCLVDAAGIPVRPIRALMRDGAVAQDGDEISVRRASTHWPLAASSTASLFRRATEISIDEHMAVLRVAAGLVDDGVSKTVNLAANASPAEVDTVFRSAWDAGLKAISIYRDGSRARQTDEEQKNERVALSVLS